VTRRLDRALARSSSEDGAPVQFVGEVHTTETYAAWRAAQRPDLRASTPPLQPGSWPLLFWTLRPSGVRALLQGKPRDLYTAPSVGMMPPAMAYQAALAAIIAGWLEDNPGSYRFAPPILVTSQAPRMRCHIELLDRTWDLPASETVGVKR